MDSRRTEELRAQQYNRYLEARLLLQPQIPDAEVQICCFFKKHCVGYSTNGNL